jgi:hypothetical protein
MGVTINDIKGLPLHTLLTKLHIRSISKLQLLVAFKASVVSQKHLCNCATTSNRLHLSLQFSASLSI